MSFTVSAEGLRHLGEVLAPFAKLRRLDGSLVPSTLVVEGGVLMLQVVPDLPRVTAVRYRVGAASGEGRLTLATDRLVDMCRRASEELTFSSSDGVVTAGPWTTPEVDPRPIPEFVESDDAVVDRQGFMLGVDAVRDAASTDLVRPRLTIIHFGGGYARACDGMKYREQRVPFSEEWDVSVFTVPLLRRYFETGRGEHLHLKQSETHQSYRSGALELVVPRPAATYLDLDALIAQPAREHNHFVLKVNRAALIEAIRDVAIMADDSSVVRLEVQPSLLSVSCTDGSNRGDVDLDCSWAGEPRVLTFYIEPLVQLLRAFDQEMIELRLGTSTLRRLTSIVVWEGGRFALLNQVRTGG